MTREQEFDKNMRAQGIDPEGYKADLRRRYAEARRNGTDENGKDADTIATYYESITGVKLHQNEVPSSSYRHKDGNNQSSDYQADADGEEIDVGYNVDVSHKETKVTKDIPTTIKDAAVGAVQNVKNSVVGGISKTGEVVAKVAPWSLAAIVTLVILKFADD